MTARPWVLVVDDDRTHCDLMGEALTRAGFQVELTSSGEEALLKGGQRDYDVVLSDIRMGTVSGLDVLESFRTDAPDTPVVLLTAFGSVDTAIQAMKRGAFDYIGKPVNLDELVLIVTRAVEHKRLVSENRQLRQSLDDHARMPTLVGQSRKMLEVFKLIGKVAPSQASVLIQGETGTGKELVARAIHDHSPRVSKRFVAINCSAIPDTLLESELFGHVKGAFSGADFLRRGLLEEASGGTCFFDEVGDLSQAAQAKLLRALQEREIRRVGSNDGIPVDLRVIAASRRDLSHLVKEGKFREDLLYRLNTITLVLPPLRERTDDIPLLVEYFLAQYGARREPPVNGIAATAMKALQRYAWPGNVRELEHVIERAVTLATNRVLTLGDLPIAVRDKPPRSGETSAAMPLPESLDERERAHVLAVLKASKGNKTLAAQRLGISRWALYRLLDRYLLRDPD